MTDLECSICLESFNLTTKFPLVLSCGHSFCNQCITSLFKESFTCPIDRKSEWRSSATLPKNYLLLEFLQKFSQNLAKCPTHNKKLKWSCNTDDQKLCSDCILAHNTHDLCKLEQQQEIPVIETRPIIKEEKKLPKQINTVQKIFQSQIWPQGAFGEIQKLIMPLNSLPENTRLLFSLTKNRPSNATFHQLCDGRGPTITVVQLNDGKIFGGFTKVPWKVQTNERGNNVKDDKAFLFKIGNESNSVRLPIRMQYRSMAVFHHRGCGPTFGVGYDLHLDFDNLNACCSRLEAYAAGANGNNERTLGGRFNGWDIREVEVYLVVF